MGRKILAVIAGFALWSVLWLAFNTAQKKLGLLPADPQGQLNDASALLMLLLASVICSLAAGYVAVLIVGVRRLAPIIILAVLLIAVGILVEVQLWRVMPLWYHLAFLVLLFPMTWAGAWLRFK
jgi:hypothetical protein